MQCDEDPLLEENRRLQRELQECREELAHYKWGVNKIADDDSKTAFYTSLPSFAIFLWLFK